MKNKIYNISIGVLSITSIVLATLDLKSSINTDVGTYLYVDKSILVIFWVDYLMRLYKSENKVYFITHNLFDLLAIIPFDSIFYFFRIFRVLRLLKLLKLLRVIGFIGKFQVKFKRFISTNGFIYLISITIGIILLGAGVYSVAEGVNYLDSVWWAVATITTVGYGDISPHTEIGRAVAIILMITGIGLIGSITSTVTAYFMNENDSTDSSEVKQELAEIKEMLKGMQ